MCTDFTFQRENVLTVDLEETIVSKNKVSDDFSNFDKS